eukprot:4896704-Pyramimonas_sp.AAC.1
MRSVLALLCQLDFANTLRLGWCNACHDIRFGDFIVPKKGNGVHPLSRLELSVCLIICQFAASSSIVHAKSYHLKRSRYRTHPLIPVK